MRRNSVRERSRRHGDRWRELSLKQIRASGSDNTGGYDPDTAMFMSMARELKEEGNRLFLTRDYEGALIKYEKSIKLHPNNHADIAYLRSNMAECYMQLGITEYPRAIHECNLALEITPNYGKALLKRARCYEALDRPDLALRDVRMMLQTEPNNLMATEIEQRLKKTFERQGSRFHEISMGSAPLPEYNEPQDSTQRQGLIERANTQKYAGRSDSTQRQGLIERANTQKYPSRLDSSQRLGLIERAYTQKYPGHSDSSQRQGLIERANTQKYAGHSDSSQNQGLIERSTTQKYAGKSVECNEETVSNEHGSSKRMFDKQKSSASVSSSLAYDSTEEKNAEDKLVVEERISNGNEEQPKRMVKLVYSQDIRWAQIPLNCDILKLRQIIADRFPNAKAILIKYTDQEGDMVTVTTTEELRWAESSAKQGSIKLFIVEVSPEQDPHYEKIKKYKRNMKLISNDENKGKLIEVRSDPVCISDWIIQFAQFFKSYVGFDVDAYLDIHQIGLKLFSEAMEETVTSEEAQDLLGVAVDKFVEMAALALFNCGNIHISRTRKKLYIPDDSSRESVLAKVKANYEWAQREFSKAGKRYEEALKIKPNFFEAVLALGQQQFEQAKLSWYYTIATEVDLETWQSGDVLMLYNNAEENMERGMQMWDDQQQQRLRDMSKTNRIESLLQKMKLDHLFKEVSADELEEQAFNTRSQIYVLWGTILYERSMMEYKLGVPVWHECLEVAVEKFELAGASATDIAVMVKNHCSNDTSMEGFGFNIDEIVQAWDEMYEAKKWQREITSYRLEPLLRRRISKLYYALESL